MQATRAQSTRNQPSSQEKGISSASSDSGEESTVLHQEQSRTPQTPVEEPVSSSDSNESE